uniref:Putative Kef-type potassium-efflux system protein n=1 Tax=Magnetococcus massalia (strain MO-1) TaxID=451514 RepID=A0A1S7LKZ3_MAGMO|nr:putative Kef-type potassium-efflux system protein [Candidatus Magnetococcus massalia]
MVEALPWVLLTAWAAILFNIILRRFGLPTLLGYMAAGLMARLALGDEQFDPHLLVELAEFGIVFLMFNIGLEFSVGQLKRMKREVLGHGGAQVGITGFVIALFCHYGLGMDPTASIIVGLALAMSSTATVLRILTERREMGKPYGQQTLGILLFQDMAVIPVFILIGLLANPNGDPLLMVLEAAVGAVAALLLLYLLARFVVTRLLDLIADTHTHELFVGSVLLIAVGAAYITHAMGFSWSLGAFFAALMISETKYKYQIETDLNPFRDLLMGLFFVTVGMQIDLQFLAAHPLSVLAVLVGLLLFKGGVIFLVIRLATNRDTALKTALALAQGGEFSFAVLELARGQDLVAMGHHQTLILAVVFSILLTPFLLRHLEALAKLLGAKEEQVEIQSHGGDDQQHDNQVVICGFEHCFQHTIEEGHIVVCGYGELGREVVRQIRQAGLSYIAIDNHRLRVGEGVAHGDAVMYGNATQRGVLEKAWVARAGTVILALEDMGTLRQVAESVAAMTDHPVLVVKVEDKAHESVLEGIPVKGIVHQYEEAARRLLDQALICELPLRFSDKSKPAEELWENESPQGQPPIWEKKS